MAVGKLLTHRNGDIMRVTICKQCGNKIIENDNDPNVHYSTPSDICMHCERFNKLKIGDWYQDSEGNYKKKG